MTLLIINNIHDDIIRYQIPNSFLYNNKENVDILDKRLINDFEPMGFKILYEDIWSNRMEN